MKNLDLIKDTLQNPSSIEEGFIINKALPFLGDPSPKNRESFYESFSNFLRSGKCHSNFHLNLLKTLTSEDYLFYKIEDLSSELALKRSFSCLAIADLIVANIKGEKLFDDKTMGELIN